MKHRLITCAASLLLCIPFTVSLTSCGSEESSALNPEECGTITGTVLKRSSGELISNAQIIAEEITTAEKYYDYCNEKGYFEMLVPEGTYNLIINKEGYYGLSTDDYIVTKGKVCSITEKLELTAVGEKIQKEDDPAETEPAVAPAPVLDYHATYEAYIEELKTRKEYRGLDGVAVTGYANMLDYLYFDMDRDGTDELIVNTGSSEADRSICFYTFKNNSIMLIGSNFSGFHVYGYYIDDETRQLVTQWAHMGNGGATWYQYNGETVAVVNEIGPIPYEDGTEVQFAEHITPLETHVGVLGEEGWSFT